MQKYLVDGMELLAVYYVKDMSQLCTVTVALHRASMSLLGAFVTLCKATISFIMSVCPHRTTVLPEDRNS